MFPRFLAILFSCLLVTACSAVLQTGENIYNPTINPSDFVVVIDNPYLPLAPGTTWIYKQQGRGKVERTEVNVTNDTKLVMGVECRVVRDRVWLNDELIEDTFDWFAQDKAGNVWYFGEASAEMKGGKVVSTKGSWESGINNALPGILVPGTPRMGQRFRQEYALGEAEDVGQVVNLSRDVSVPYGEFKKCLKMMEWDPLGAPDREFKLYAPGVGLVLELGPGGGRTELMEMTSGIK